MTDVIRALLPALLSNDNHVRREAEVVYTRYLNDSTIPTVGALLQIFSCAHEVRLPPFTHTIHALTALQDLTLRSFAGILLRRIVDPSAAYSARLDSACTAQLRQQLMAMWTQETQPIIQRRLAHVMAQSAAGGKWVDLIVTVIGYAQAQSGSALVSLMSLLEIIADYCPDDVLTHVAILVNFLGANIGSTDPTLRVACAKTIGACIVALEDDAARNAFRPSLMPLLRVVGAALEVGDEIDATNIIESLVTIAQIQPLFFKDVLDHVSSAMITVARSSSLEFSTRSMAIELLVTLTETAPAMARRTPALLEGLVPLAMAISLDLEESDAEWARGTYSEEPCDDNSSVGEEAIERMAAGMGGKNLAPLVFSQVQAYAANGQSAPHRRAAVAAMSRLGEGAPKVFKGYLKSALDFLLPALSDSSPRVQYQAIQAIGQLSVLYPDDVPTMLNMYMNTLIALLNSPSTCERVRGHVASALINMTNPASCPEEAMLPFLDPLLQALMQCLQLASIEVQPHCLTLLGCVAQVSHEKFARYYPSFMPGIKTILRHATGEAQSSLRGKAMQCVGLVGDAVGEELFFPDAVEIMEILLGALKASTETVSSPIGGDDTLFDYILPACCRISKALGQRFTPYLLYVMPAVLAAAAAVVEFTMEDADDSAAVGEQSIDEETGLESLVLALHGGVKKRVTMNTHAVQQKNQAARMIFEFAESLGGNLFSFLPQCFDAISSIVTDKHSSEARAAASLALAKLFDAALDAVKIGAAPPSFGVAAMESCINKLLSAIQGEINAESRSCAVTALRDILQAAYEAGGEEDASGVIPSSYCKPDIDSSATIAGDLLKRCQESVIRRSEKEEAIKRNEGLDEEDRMNYATQLEEEEDLLEVMVDALGQLVKMHGPAFMPIFDSMIAGAFSPYLSPKQPQALQVAAVCMVDDAIEFGGTMAFKYIPQALGLFVANAESDHPTLRQCSVYGIAVALRVAHSCCLPGLPQLLQALTKLVNIPDADSEDNIGITDNAVFGIGTICTRPEYRTALGTNLAPLTSLWLSKMPLRADEKQAKAAHRELCDAIERGDSNVLGQGYCHVSSVLRIIGDVLEHEAKRSSGVDTDEDALMLAHPTTVERMKGIVRMFAGAVDPQQKVIVQTAFSGLTADIQAVLRTVVTP